MIILALLIGGTSRALVGAGMLTRWAVYPPAAIICGWIGLAPTPGPTGMVPIDWVLWSALVSCHLGLGRTEWESARHMALRFGLPAVILVAPLVYLGMTDMSHAGSYFAMSLVAGLIYPVRALFDHLIPSWSRPFVDSARVMEFIAGACIFGGLSIL